MIVEVHGLELFGRHGVNDDERRDGQTFLFDVTLEINDDGSGITEAGTMGPGSLGILGMRERAAALGGVLEVVPREEGGTRVAAWFPPAASAVRR